MFSPRVHAGRHASSRAGEGGADNACRMRRIAAIRNVPEPQAGSSNRPGVSPVEFELVQQMFGQPVGRVIFAQMMPKRPGKERMMQMLQQIARGE